jgi:hypothetical protein
MYQRPKLNIWIGGEKIETAKNYWILGVIFDEWMNWKEHIKNVKARADKILNIIKSVCHTQ